MRRVTATALIATLIGALLPATALASGGGWKIHKTPNPSGSTGSTLEALSCSSAKACTAVGGYNNGSAFVTLAERGGGANWAVQPTPNPSGLGSQTTPATGTNSTVQCRVPVTRVTQISMTTVPIAV